jgi:hypothetical protein
MCKKMLVEIVENSANFSCILNERFPKVLEQCLQNTTVKTGGNIRLSWNKLREFLFCVPSLYQAKVYL